jgi:DNA-binding PadR family transcriptional regulator
MPDPKLTDAELVLLSLICEQPLHGYQLEQRITERNMRAWTDLSTSSIYYILGRLEEKGFIEEQDSAPSERGIPRKTYRITAEGEIVWKHATMQALSSPTITYTNFLMGLHNLWKIPTAEALVAVQSYRSWLENDLERQRVALDSMGEIHFPVDVLFEYGFVLGEAELSFLTDLIERLSERADDRNPMIQS